MPDNLLYFGDGHTRRCAMKIDKKDDWSAADTAIRWQNGSVADTTIRW